MYAMDIRNDVIGLVLRENYKSKQVTLLHGRADVTTRYTNVDDHDLFWNVGQANCILKYDD
jgi:hypothetical protein